MPAVVRFYTWCPSDAADAMCRAAQMAADADTSGESPPPPAPAEEEPVQRPPPPPETAAAPPEPLATAQQAQVRTPPTAVWVSMYNGGGIRAPVLSLPRRAGVVRVEYGFGGQCLNKTKNSIKLTIWRLIRPFSADSWNCNCI